MNGWLAIRFQVYLQSIFFIYSIYSWNPKQPFINGCFNWMIQNLYMGNSCLTKHPLKTDCLEFQVYVFFPTAVCTEVLNVMLGKASESHACDFPGRKRTSLQGKYG